MTENPYAAPASHAVADDLGDESAASWETITQPLRDSSGWMRILGSALILLGVLYCLSILGIIVGWIPIWIGILLLKSGDHFRLGSAASTREGIQQLAKTVRIVGITLCVFLVLLVLYFVGVLLVFGMMAYTGAPP